MLLAKLYLCFLSKGFPALVMHSNANGKEYQIPPCFIPDLAVHVSYLKMLKCCCSAGDVPLSLPGDEVDVVL